MGHHYLINFLLATVGMVGFLYTIYIYIKQSPKLGGLGQITPPKGQHGLIVESALNLEARKRLYVIGYGQQRFLVATSTDKTELLATLETQPNVESIIEASESIGKAADNVVPLRGAQTGFMDRFRASLKMVITDRLTRLGGK